MIAEVQPSGKVAETFLALAAALTGRAETKRSRASLFDPLLSKLVRRKAS
jgi:pilus assembly protein CpaE